MFEPTFIDIEPGRFGDRDHEGKFLKSLILAQNERWRRG
jgi:hypothetical protein